MKPIYLSRFMKGLIAAALIATLPSGLARAADTSENHGQFSASDYKFAVAAACGGATEVTLGQMAADKSSNEAVKQFGRRMVEDHGKAGRNLQALAASKGATLASQPDAAQQKHIDHMSKLSGGQFDNEYVSMMLEDHKKDLKTFKHAAEKADDADLRTFAANVVPVIESHLKDAIELGKATPTLSSE